MAVTAPRLWRLLLALRIEPGRRTPEERICCKKYRATHCGNNLTGASHKGRLLTNGKKS